MRTLTLILSLLHMGSAQAESISCPASELNIPNMAQQEILSAPAEVREKVLSAIASLIGTTPDIDFDQGISLGSSFLVRPEAPRWLSAIHVTWPILDGDKLILYVPGEPLFKLNEDGLSSKLDEEYIKKNSQQLVQLKSYLQPSFNYYYDDHGFDFSQFAHNDINFSEQRKKALKPLKIRNLERNPLSLNEPLFVAGMQLGKFRLISCAYSGVNNRFFSEYQTINLFMNCPEIKVDETGHIPMGGISGGAIVDSQARAVAVFNGYSYPTAAPTKLSIRGTPIYEDRKDGPLMPFPPLRKTERQFSRCMPCFSHDAESFGKRSTCILIYDETLKEFKFKEQML